MRKKQHHQPIGLLMMIRSIKCIKQPLLSSFILLATTVLHHHDSNNSNNAVYAFSPSSSYTITAITKIGITTKSSTTTRQRLLLFPKQQQIQDQKYHDDDVIYFPPNHQLTSSSLSLLFRSKQQTKRPSIKTFVMSRYSDQSMKKGNIQRLLSLSSILLIRFQQLKRSMKKFMLATTLFFVLLSSTIKPQSAFARVASTTTASVPLIERILEKTSPTVDEIIDQYLQKYMFDDDKYDPIESTYREAYDDAMTGKHVSALREITQSILQQQGSSTGGGIVVEDHTSTGSNINKGGINVGSVLISAIRFLQTKVGLSESTAILILAVAFVVAGPTIFLFSGMIVGGISKRNMNKLMKSRYGDTYTVDATPKQEEIITAPDDDEDDDEEDNDSDDDDDEDEDEDEKPKGKTDKKPTKK